MNYLIEFEDDTTENVEAPDIKALAHYIDQRIDDEDIEGIDEVYEGSKLVTFETLKAVANLDVLNVTGRSEYFT